ASFGWNMQRRIRLFNLLAASRLRVDDHLGDPGNNVPDLLLDAGGRRMGRGQALGRVENEREEHDQAFVCVEEADGPRRCSGRLEDGTLDLSRIRIPLATGCRLGPGLRGA